MEVAITLSEQDEAHVKSHVVIKVSTLKSKLLTFLTYFFGSCDEVVVCVKTIWTFDKENSEIRYAGRPLYKFGATIQYQTSTVRL